ncbi:MAG TPA: nucleotide exchange factor GrpE [Mycobacteriales bacterium]|nr:nucleotide exchange factor GrpE [Mycobacteriales bacterium]
MTQDHFPSEGQTSFDPESPPARDPQATEGSAADPATAADPAAAAGTAEAPAGEGVEETAAQADAEVEADLGDMQKLVDGLTNDLKRLQAEYVNYKRRVDRDRELVLQNATYSVLSALLPVLDDVDRAREHGELEGGFKAIAESLERIVAGQGLVKFGASGDEFDPRFHEALMHAHSKDVTTTTCRDIVSAGYMIGDRVVRPARVTVVDPEPADAGAGDTGDAAGGAQS